MATIIALRWSVFMCPMISLSTHVKPNIRFYALPFFWPTVPKPEPDPGRQYIGVIPILLHPFSRGSVHIRSTDPFDHPEIDFSIFDNGFDLGVLMQGVKYFREVIAKTDAFKEALEKEVAPASHGDTDEGLINYLKGGITTAFHPLGTAAMMKREEGGVVDERLRVYGVERLRVVCAFFLIPRSNLNLDLLRLMLPFCRSNSAPTRKPLYTLSLRR